MDVEGANGFVLFNRLFQPDIDIEEEELKMPYNLSSKNDKRIALRYSGLLAGTIHGSICANNGIHDVEDLISVLLAGADAAQIVSTIYKNGLVQVTTILEDLAVWMKNKGYSNLDDFKGKLSKNNLKEPFAYKRAQYVDYLMKSKVILKNYQV